MTNHTGRRALGLLATTLLLLLMSACGFAASGTSSQTPAQLLQSSATAMKQLKSAHLEMKIALGLQASSTGSSTSPFNLTINVGAKGDEILPNKVSLQLSLAGLGTGTSTNIAEVVDGNKIFFQYKGQWYVIDKSKLLGSSGNNPLSGLKVPDLSQVLGLIKNLKLTDHGDETLNGESLRHLSIDLDANSLKQLLESSGQLGSLGASTQQIINKLLSSNTFKGSLNLWIDESTAYIHRVEIKFNLNLDLSSLLPSGSAPGGNAPSSVAVTFDTVLDLSKFNDPSITITDPANATPIDNPSGIFSK